MNVNELNDLYAKRDLLMEELKKINQQISGNSELAEQTKTLTTVESILSVQNKLERIKMGIILKNNEINQEVLNKKDSMNDYEWFSYMGYAERRKTLNEYEGELKSLEIKKVALEKQITMQYGDYEKAKDILVDVNLELGVLPEMIERVKLRVDSSKQYYKMVSGQISKMDYETYLFGNKKVQSDEDADYVRELEISYRNSLSDNSENLENNQRYSHRQI